MGKTLSMGMHCIMLALGAHLQITTTDNANDHFFSWAFEDALEYGYSRKRPCYLTLVINASHHAQARSQGQEENRNSA